LPSRHAGRVHKARQVGARCIWPCTIRPGGVHKTCRLDLPDIELSSRGGRRCLRQAGLGPVASAGHEYGVLIAPQQRLRIFLQGHGAQLSVLMHLRPLRQRDMTLPHTPCKHAGARRRLHTLLPLMTAKGCHCPVQLTEIRPKKPAGDQPGKSSSTSRLWFLGGKVTLTCGGWGWWQFFSPFGGAGGRHA
jgi:hypothetical protein